MKVEAPGSFEAVFAGRLRSELDAIPVRSFGAWPVMRRTRRIAFASAAAAAIGAALILGAVGAFAYGSPGVWVQNVVNSFHARPDRHSNGLPPGTELTPSAAPIPSTPAPIERESPSPGPPEHESPEPTSPSHSTGGESPEPGDGSHSPPPPGTSSPSPPPDE
jgi:hypothetical protein